jgi:hypothetical protein
MARANLRRGGWGRGGAALAGLLIAGAGSARADTFGIEAESPSENFEQTNTLGGTLTSPFVVKDSALASGGRYLEGETGRKKIDGPPETGVACYKFAVNRAGSYRVWGRVMAPTDGDDSFWVRMDTGAWIAWNEITLGSNWHWDFVHGSGTPAVPVMFDLDTDVVHQLCVGYREDGTRLDRMIVTDDTHLNPNAAITGPPAAASMRVVMGKTTALVEWANVLGATSYTLRRSANGGAFTTRANAIPGHSFQDTGLTAGTSYCYVVRATGPTGSTDSPLSCSHTTVPELALVTETDSFSITPPLIFVGDLGGVQVDGFATPPGFNSLTAAPATGWARFDFQIAANFRIKIWGKVATPDDGSDSFWFRMDRGTWVKWNNWHPVGCDWDSLHDSDNNDAPVLFDLTTGTHSLEFAYREDGAGLDRVFIGTELRDPPIGCQADHPVAGQ